MYKFTSRVRYSEVDNHKKLDAFSIINYFQDCSIFESEEIGMGLKPLEERHLAWMISSWQIHINEFPVFKEEICTNTWAYKFDNIYGYRNFTMTNSKGNVYAYANSIWVLIDTTTGTPCRLPKDISSAYPLSDPYEMTYASRKIKLPDCMREQPSFIVPSSCLDTNNHVNNGQYIKMAEAFLPKDYQVKNIRADYRCSAKLGDRIVPYYHGTDSIYTIALCQENTKPYAIIEFTA